LLTDSHAIREVVLFPLLRAESQEASDSTDGAATQGPGGGSDLGGKA
jgi:hypothetical protein